MSLNQDTFRQEQQALNKMRRKLFRQINEFPPEDVDLARVPVIERDLDRIFDLKEEYQEAVDTFVDNYENLEGGYCYCWKCCQRTCQKNQE